MNRGDRTPAGRGACYSLGPSAPFLSGTATDLRSTRVMSTEREKQVAAEAAADLVGNGMTVGLGTGSTVAFLLPALARRSLDILCAATSPRTEHAARELGRRREDVASIDRVDITIDGADQITPDGWP